MLEGMSSSELELVIGNPIVVLGTDLKMKDDVYTFEISHEPKESSHYCYGSLLVESVVFANIDGLFSDSRFSYLVNGLKGPQMIPVAIQLIVYDENRNYAQFLSKSDQRIYALKYSFVLQKFIIRYDWPVSEMGIVKSRLNLGIDYASQLKLKYFPNFDTESK